MFEWIAKLGGTPPQIGTTWGVARSMVAGASAMTLLFNTPSAVNVLSTSLLENGFCDGVQAATLTCLFEGGEYELTSHVILPLIFLTVASGVLPRVTGPLHVFAALSFQNVLSTTDGGEHVALVFSVLALPICLVDPRMTHWKQWPERAISPSMQAFENSTAATFLFAIRVQVSLIYFVAAVAKLAVPEWVEGTAVYYWSIAPYLAPPEALAGIIQILIAQPILLLMATYLPLLLELVLGISILLPRNARKPILLLGLSFHIAIGVLFSIWSFAIIMCAMLFLLLAPKNLKDLFSPKSLKQDVSTVHPDVSTEPGKVVREHARQDFSDASR